MVCNNCGCLNNEESNFCKDCGSSLKEKSEGKHTRKQVYAGVIHKCPNCGDNIDTFENICDACGYEIRAANKSNIVEKFTFEYDAINNRNINKGLGQSISEKIGLKEKENSHQKIVSLIKNFSVPNNIEDLFEFLIYATDKIDTSIDIDDDKIEELNDAWILKAKQTYEKIKITSTKHSRFKEVESIYLAKINEIARLKKERKAKVIKGLKIASLIIIIIGILSAIIVPLLFVFLDEKVYIRDNASDYIGRQYSDVLLELEDSGFKNIELKEIEISPNDITKTHGNVLSLIIEGSTNFESMDEFSSRAKVQLSYYVIKYTINIRIEFDQNLFLNKYDVFLFFNDIKKEEIKHGQKVDFQFRISAGSNMIRFKKTDDPNVIGSISLNVEGNLNITYKISSNKNNIDIKEISKESISFESNNSVILEKNNLISLLSHKGDNIYGNI